MTSTETIKQAIEALTHGGSEPWGVRHESLTNLRALLADMDKAEPTGWLCVGAHSRCISMCNPYPTTEIVTPLYAIPPDAQAEIDRLRQSLHDATQELERCDTTIIKACIREKNLRAENESLRKDAERYRWLKDGRRSHVFSVMLCGGSFSGHDQVLTGKKLDTAIDKAMEGKE